MLSLTELYALLFAHYGDLRWWPAKTPFEVVVGAVLTQNTNWTNVERAIANFGENL
jgi:endonuclease-3 related protein